MKNALFLLSILIISCNAPSKEPAAQKAATTEKTEKSNKSLVFVGTYTEKLGHVNGKASGIYTCELDTLTGELTVIDSTKDLANPSFLTISPDKKYLYAVGENGGKPEQPFGSVAAYRITEGGKLLKINEVSTNGVAPCYVSTDRGGKNLFVANYVTGNLATYKIKEDGSIGDSMKVDKIYKEAKWVHMIIQAPGFTYFSIDKGVDRIYAYRDKYAGGIGQVNYYSTAKGAGPRHMDFTPNAKFAYVINENNSTINAYAYDVDKGNLKEIQSISTLPSDFKGQNTCAEIFVHPNGKFVYGSNRGHNSIAVFEITTGGGLRLVEHISTQGEIPRSFMITPNGKLLLVANQNSDNVVAFSIDENTGKLTPTGKNTRVWTPVCLKMM